MLIPKKDRLAVYQYLFKEGVLYAKKDFNLPKHPELDVCNLYVIKLLQSLHAKELVKEIYAWRHYYVRTFGWHRYRRACYVHIHIHEMHALACVQRVRDLL